MSIWDPFDPRLQQLKREYNYMYQEYQRERENIIREHDGFVSALDTYRSYTAYNSGLTMIGSVLHMTDDQFDALITKTISAPVNLKPINRLPQQLQDEFKSKTGGMYILNAVYELSKVSLDPALFTPMDNFLSGIIAMQDLLYGLAVGGIGVLPGTENIPAGLRTMLSLPLQGAAFVGAIVLDILTGPFQLAEEEREYEEAIYKVRRALNDLSRTRGQIQEAEYEITRNVAKQKQLFIDTIKKLNNVKTATFDINLTVNDPDSKFLTAQQAALNEYGIIMVIRTDWKNTIANDPSITFDIFKTFETTKLSHRNFTKEELGELADIVRNSLK
ncbi:MAG: hypothetical protein GY765_39970 [bacterium]|nr:hypothetical protein [bacterium]